MSETWFSEVSEPEYLDGIQSGVTVFGPERRPVAYAFREGEGRLIAAAPKLLHALKNLLAVHEGEGGTEYHAGDIARAAIHSATKEQS